MDRAYRFGQLRNVITYRLITAGTVEEKMYRLQVFKGGLTQSVMAAATKAGGGAGEATRFLTKTDIKDLFILGDTAAAQTKTMIDAVCVTPTPAEPDIARHLRDLADSDGPLAHASLGISHHDVIFSLDAATAARLRDMSASAAARARGGAARRASGRAAGGGGGGSDSEGDSCGSHGTSDSDGDGGSDDDGSEEGDEEGDDGILFVPDTPAAAAVIDLTSSPARAFDLSSPAPVLTVASPAPVVDLASPAPASPSRAYDDGDDGSGWNGGADDWPVHSPPPATSPRGAVDADAGDGAGAQPAHSPPPQTAASPPAAAAVCARHLARCEQAGMPRRVLASLTRCACALSPDSKALLAFAEEELADAASAAAPPRRDEHRLETALDSLVISDAEPSVHLAAMAAGRALGWLRED